ncbi:MAG: hypothetical protein AAGF46_05940 [Pseudomonadota bacterium]
MRKLYLVCLIVVAVPVLGFATVYTLSELQLRDRQAVLRFAEIIPSDSVSIDRGHHIARTRGCFGCHGQQLQGYDFDEQWDWPKHCGDSLRSLSTATMLIISQILLRTGLGALMFS